MKGLSREDGDIIVEATFVYPVMFFVLIVLFYSAIFLCQKANLQANLQTALLYFKNVESDSFVVLNDDADYQKADGTIAVIKYQDASSIKLLFPYRNFITRFKPSKFEEFFRGMSGRMFFYTTSDIEIKAKANNYVLYKDITATATQTITPAINLGIIGGPKEMVIEVSGTTVVQDNDEFIRNADLVADIVMGTKLGEYINTGKAKVINGYQKIKEKLGI